MSQFKKGDRVVVDGTIGVKHFTKCTGTVIDAGGYTFYGDRIEVMFDSWNDGHCGGLDAPYTETQKNHWFIYEGDFDKVTVIEAASAPSWPVVTPLLPQDPAERKRIPLASGLCDYFASALIEVAKVSWHGNAQHNPGQPLHWARGKSMDHADTMLRHFMERGTIDGDGTRHSAKMVWRALAILQMELEHDGHPKSRGARDENV